ncbi:hypothetical protein BVRB_003570 [Beta vulgaris subsp. vulgaris]|uniref:Uncharacterized protein n=1 Tax=Beta vulgaris subsp. vulgaris TaxID=3555 RepID=A0A0J8B437_BETVV|nr:hypothetical protein BVRB_003570 [Beta vulgaris subsp. vulgaris]
MLGDQELEPVMVLQLIDDIQRSGLGHHFAKEIESALSRMLCNLDALKSDLHATSLGFRLLRQMGFLVSQDVFKQFKDGNGNFRPSLCNDIKGMISLYEASYLAYEGEHLLGEAKDFTLEHLIKLRLDNEDKLISEYVHYILELPLRYRLPRLEARHYIETHPNWEDTKNIPAWLELAKIDFNMTQLTYQEDLHEMSRWWKDLGLSDNLSFARDRLIECFYWGIGTYPSSKLEHSFCRKSSTKLCKFVTILDDIYDVYGHMHELEHFTNVVERWDINAIDDLPDYMRLTFLALYNYVNETGYEILKQKGHNCIPSLKKAWKDMCKAFLVEVKWCHNSQIPTFEDYINNGWVSVSGSVILTHAYFMVSLDITPEALDCLNNNHDILRLPSIVFRLSNDLATFEAETERGETTNALSCYVKQTGVSLEDARKHMRKLIHKCWKKLNKIQVKNETPFSIDFIENAMNLARTSQWAYQYGDAHGSPELIKKQILSMLVDPL